MGGDLKIPSVIYYDAQGTVRAAGAEATLPHTLIMAHREAWTKVEWFSDLRHRYHSLHLNALFLGRFKLHLSPKTNPLPDFDGSPLLPLPPHKTAMQVFADFLRYLHQCTRKYIQEAHHGGQTLWTSVEDEIIYVLSHPNGWGGLQQRDLRLAAVFASLVPDYKAGQARIRFVTEGEACLHFCINKGLVIGSQARSSPKSSDHCDRLTRCNRVVTASWLLMLVEGQLISAPTKRCPSHLYMRRLHHLIVSQSLVLLLNE
jgi:hypothetical protein